MLDRKVVIYKDAGCAGKETTLPIREGLETVGSQTVLFVYILIVRLFDCKNCIINKLMII